MHNVHRGVIHLLNCDKKYKNLKTWLAENTHISRKFVKSTITESASDYDKFLIGSDIVWGMDIIGKDTTYFR